MSSKLFHFLLQEKQNAQIEGAPPIELTAKNAGSLKNYRIYGNTETKTRSYSGAAPLSFPIVDGAVSNYRIYGNTENGESVGGLVTDSQSEHYGNYAIPITNNSETANIYLDEPLRKVGDEAEYVDYATQKWHRVRKNLFNPSTNIVNGSLTKDGGFVYYAASLVTDYIPISAGIYTFNMDNPNYAYVCAYNSGKQHIAKSGNFETWLNTPLTFSMPEDGYIRVVLKYDTNTAPIEPSDARNIMLNAGAEVLPYEPYIENTEVDVTIPALPAQSPTNSLSVDTTVQPSSVAVDVSKIVSCGDKVTDNQSVNYGKYKIPVTLTADSAETTDIYLDEPLAKSGNNADYIDYATQKRHNSDGTESSVTLPAISTLAGTNTMTVGTEVQPSKVYVKGKIKKLKTM